MNSNCSVNSHNLNYRFYKKKSIKGNRLSCRYYCNFSFTINTIMYNHNLYHNVMIFLVIIR